MNMFIFPAGSSLYSPMKNGGLYILYFPHGKCLRSNPALVMYTVPYSKPSLQSSSALSWLA